jgi:hypothetical protein
MKGGRSGSAPQIRRIGRFGSVPSLWPTLRLSDAADRRGDPTIRLGARIRRPLLGFAALGDGQGPFSNVVGSTSTQRKFRNGDSGGEFTRVSSSFGGQRDSQATTGSAAKWMQ